MKSFEKLNNTAKSLCAVLTALILILTCTLNTFAVDETTEDTTSPSVDIDPEYNEQYRYAIEIEFGSFGFYYDYGTWDVNDLCYKSNQSSADPSADTKQGSPGWYGFDGNANKISVNIMFIEDPVRINLNFELGNLDANCVNLDANCVKMFFYSSNDFLSANCLNEDNPNSYSFDMTETGNEEIYFSLSGKPTITTITSDNEIIVQDFVSSNLAVIGQLTLEISLSSDNESGQN